ncbi:hypothetical protein SELMODRAFT_110441 [Selaginella moellendorffii]|uniref:catechol O-methyltransferase n=2 Tax=Selaginella moellendorffii TaxID=88036 RepID=D8S729_SELML|nr:hypothetical protein SELMODRAFT_110441 [Selaginella moellendorffii]
MTSPSTFFRGQVGDGREQRLLEHVVAEAEPGNPKSVLDVIDRYTASKGTWFMNIGDDKGPILDSVVERSNPRLALELGAYCGYSAVRIASRMKDPNGLLISIEMNPQNVQIARKMVEIAGLSDRVRVLEGTLESCLAELKSIIRDELQLSAIDLVFIDHNKNVYLKDYLQLKEEGLLKSGSVIVADNMGFPGSPSFWRYLKKNAQELHTVEHRCKFEYIGWISDIVTVSTCV